MYYVAVMRHCVLLRSSTLAPYTWAASTYVVKQEDMAGRAIFYPLVNSHLLPCPDLCFVSILGPLAPLEWEGLLTSSKSWVINPRQTQTKTKKRDHDAAGLKSGLWPISIGNRAKTRPESKSLQSLACKAKQKSPCRCQPVAAASQWAKNIGRVVIVCGCLSIGNSTRIVLFSFFFSPQLFAIVLVCSSTFLGAIGPISIQPSTGRSINSTTKCHPARPLGALATAGKRAATATASTEPQQQQPAVPFAVQRSNKARAQRIATQRNATLRTLRKATNRQQTG